MTLFGRTSCNEHRDWCVRLECSNMSVKLTEQLNKKEATKFLKEIEKEIEDVRRKGKQFIKVEREMDESETVTSLININQVQRFKLCRE